MCQRYTKQTVNILRYIQFSRLLTRQKSSIVPFCLRQRITLNIFTLKRLLIYHYFKKNYHKLLFKKYKFYLYNIKTRNSIIKVGRGGFYKYLKNKIIFLNFNKKQYWKFRVSRFIHWGGLIGGDLNKYRDQKFIKNYVKTISQGKIFNFYPFLLCHMLHMVLS